MYKKIVYLEVSIILRLSNPWCEFRLWNLIVAYMVKKFPAFYKTQSFIIGYHAYKNAKTTYF
jgi:hypothetical protein